MTNAIRRLGDRLVATLVPELTAAACEPRGWFEHRCHSPFFETRFCWQTSLCAVSCNPWEVTGSC